MWQWSDVLLERSYSLVYLNCVKHFSDWSIFSAFWWFTINFRNYATFEGFLDKQYFSLHTRFFAESKLEALSNARRPAVCKASGKPLTGLLPASVAQSIKLICRRKTGSYCRTNDESLPAANNFTEIGFPSFKHKTLLTGFNDTSTAAKDHIPKFYMETPSKHLTSKRTYSEH